MPATTVPNPVLSPDHNRAAPLAQASTEEATATPWRHLDAWLSQPRSARSAILWLSLYLALSANWPANLRLMKPSTAPATTAIGGMKNR